MASDPSSASAPHDGDSVDMIVLAGGCFWCVEAVFRPLRGVIDVASGYAGGTAETANYRAVCGGATDHAEAVRIRFDPRQISLEQIFEIFFHIAHDPTQRDRQGADIGRQYRSAIFYRDEDQRRIAEEAMRRIATSGDFDQPLATRLEPLEEFFPAEGYHQDYAALNPNQPYIACNVPPKLAKLRAGFGEVCRRE